jgi:hypothetical protein
MELPKQRPQPPTKITKRLAPKQRQRQRNHNFFRKVKTEKSFSLHFSLSPLAL